MPPDQTVSVLLPTYNRAAYLAEALDSVLAQSRKADQIIVIDDGSTDGTAAVLARYGTAVTVLTQPNAGKLAAVSAGLDHATGDLVWIMDDDDIATPDAIRALAAPFAAAGPSLVMTYGRMTRFGADGEAPVPYPADDRPFLIRLMEDCFITGHPCVMVRRAALDRIRPFDPQIFASDDYFLHLHVALQGRVMPVDALVLRQRQHDGPRGPDTNRYSEAERAAKWIDRDAYILTGLLDSLPLSAFLDTPAQGALSDRDRRRALAQRAVIAGRKKLWDRALHDLAAALRIAPGVPLDPRELAVLSGLFGSRYGFDEVLASPDILTAIRATTESRLDRAAVLAAISRPILQQIRARRDVPRALRGWFRLMDARSTGQALGASLMRNLSRAALKLRPNRAANRF